MRRFALIAAIVGIGVLLGLLIIEPTRIDGNSLDGLIDGQAISFEGTVDEVRELRSGSLIVIDDVRVYCECRNVRAGQRVRVQGVVEEFDGNLRLRALILNVIE
ncbi:MAG: hypothetical protein AABY16_02235 [Nanoarchaeota archaeon]